LWVRGSANPVAYFQSTLYMTHAKGNVVGQPATPISVVDNTGKTNTRYIYDRIMYEVNGTGEMRVPGGTTVKEPLPLVLKQESTPHVPAPSVGGVATTSTPVMGKSQTGMKCPKQPAKKYGAQAKWCTCCRPAQKLVPDT